MSFFPEFERPAEPRPARVEAPIWVSPPSSELPVPVAVTTVLGRRPGAALCLRRIDVYRAGWVFALSVRASRLAGMTDEQWIELMDCLHPHRPFRRGDAEGSLRVGVELPDGSKAIGGDMSHRYPFDGAEPDRPQLTMRGGGGGGSDEDYDFRMDAWLWPAPQAGSLRLVYDWAALKLNEGSITIETTPLITAQENVRSLWAQ
jgi:hypothetical protein